jgi:hypothetical protein
LVPVFGKKKNKQQKQKQIQNPRTIGSGYFKNLKEPVGFMREPIKNLWFDGPVI